MIGLLRNNKNFFYYFMGNLISSSGDFIDDIALAQLTFYVTKSTLLMSCVFVIKILFLVVSLFTSVLVDRWKKKRILVLSSLVQAVNLMVLFCLYVQDSLNVGLLFLFIVVQTLFSILSISARNAIIPLLVPREDLVKASASLSVVMQVLQITAYFFAGILIVRFDVTGAMAIDSLSFVLAALSLLKIKLPAEEKEEKGRQDFSFREELNRGFAFIKKEKIILAVMLVTFGGNFFSAPTESLMPAYFSESQFDTAAFSRYMLLAAVGSVMGSCWVAKVNAKLEVSRLGGMLAGGFLLGGLGIAGLYVNRGLVPYVCAWLIGLSEGFVSVLNASLIQIKTPQEMMARVFSVFKCTSYIASPLGVVAAGALGEYLKLNIIFLPFGIGLLVVAVYTGISFRRRGVLAQEVR